jgi:ABC-type transporter Mla subunit MlaD
MPKQTVPIPLTELSARQLALYNTRLLLELRNLMSDLDQAVDDLKAAVDGVAQRLLPKIQDLEAALAAAQADDADVNDAVSQIRAEIDNLNALGQDPSTPVDTDATPVDPPEVEVPADPDAGGTTDESTDSSSPDTSDQSEEDPSATGGDEAAPAEGDTPTDTGDTATTDSGDSPPRDPETGQFVSSDG